MKRAAKNARKNAATRAPGTVCVDGAPADQGVVHPALRRYCTYRFYKCAVRLRASVNESLARHGVIGIQLGVLRVLEHDGPASQVDLGRGLGIDKASMVGLLDDLERQGLLRRVALKEDRRVKKVQLTPKGSRLLHRASRTRDQAEQRFFRPLSRADRRQLERILDKLLGA